jgi:H+/Na+-translocating ferredoxin:NAD+ oxidoreductase subunit D
MLNEKLYVAAHAPFWHNGNTIKAKSYNTMLAALPAAIMGIYLYGVPALRVLALATASAMIWEWLITRVMKRSTTIGDGNAAVIGLLLGMLLPATMPWYAVILGTLLAILVGKQIYGGIGCNPCNPTLVAYIMLLLSWNALLDFDAVLVNYDFGVNMVFPIGALKHFGPSVIEQYNLTDLFMGRQAGAIGATFGLGLIIGGVYLILRGYIRWELSLSFLAGVFITALLFHVANPAKYGGPLFHLLSGYTLIGAFFLVTEDSSSPVNFIPMLVYGAAAGFLTMLIRNIGSFVMGVPFAVLMMNLANPLIDKIRPKALGRKIDYA